jgi:hypothetical protein
MKGTEMQKEQNNPISKAEAKKLMRATKVRLAKRAKKETR